jgi:hypothetical protein
MKPGIELKIANTPEAGFLLQAELNSIERGSVYAEGIQNYYGGRLHYTYRGYFDSKNEKDGPIIRVYHNGTTEFEDHSKNRAH